MANPVTPAPREQAAPAAPVSFIDTRASVQLDRLRAIAAVLVLISHWKTMFFVDYPRIPAMRALFAVPYILCSAGRQAVLVFFVLSGYLIGGSVLRAENAGNWQWRSYLTHRLVRLWIVLVPGLLLGCVWDWIGIHFSHAPGLYSGLSARSHGVDAQRNLGAGVFFGNLAFLQTTFVDTFGSNTALWSLANEFWYYLMFPLGWLALRRRTGHLLRAVYAVLLFAIAWFGRGSILPLFPCWLAGALLAVLPTLRLRPAHRIAAAAFYWPLLFFIAKTPPFDERTNEFVLSGATFLFVWTILSDCRPAPDSIAVRLVRQTARFSYTLYLTHMPLLLLLAAWVAADRLWSPTQPGHDAVALLVLAVLVAYAYLVASVTEFRTGQVRRWVESQLDTLTVRIRRPDLRSKA
jgi:peptidoglycan/LPS O-acetylase OafA/YrhL